MIGYWLLPFTTMVVVIMYQQSKIIIATMSERKWQQNVMKNGPKLQQSDLRYNIAELTTNWSNVVLTGRQSLTTHKIVLSLLSSQNTISSYCMGCSFSPNISVSFSYFLKSWLHNLPHIWMHIHRNFGQNPSINQRVRTSWSAVVGKTTKMWWSSYVI